MLHCLLYCVLYLLCLHAVTLSLDPPATDAGDGLYFGYCPTVSASVNVTCEVEGLNSLLGINPQVVIGSDPFYLGNKAKLAKWGITVFLHNHTLLFFELSLTPATGGLSIRCRSETYWSPGIILQSSKN